MNSVSSRPVDSQNEITLFDLWRVLWGGKYLILVITGLFTTAAIVYSLTATEWYRAEALLMPVEDESLSGIRDQLSGLAAIAGVATSGGRGHNTTEALAVLRSREFARNFIQDFGLLAEFLAGQHETDDKPDIREAVRYFHDNVLRVSEDRDTGLVRLRVEWTDPSVAAEWANAIVERLNERMRSQALEDAEANIKFLQDEMSNTSFAVLQQSIGSIMESEMQKLMLARGYEEYAVHVIDAAIPPLKRSRPRRTVIVASVLVVSGTFAAVVVFVRNATRRDP